MVWCDQPAGTPMLKPRPLNVFSPLVEAAAFVLVLIAAGFDAVGVTTSLNFGAATTSLAGSDHDICCAPVGRDQSNPRTRYHHVPGVTGSTTEVAEVMIPSAPVDAVIGLNGYWVLLHWTS